MCPETGHTRRHEIIRKGTAFYRPLKATAFHRIPAQVISRQWVDQLPRCPISERTVSQSKACLQGVNESFPPSVKTTDQPGGASHFTTPLDPVPFWNLHLVAENPAAKNHSAVLRVGLQTAAYPPGSPHF